LFQGRGRTSSPAYPLSINLGDCFQGTLTSKAVSSAINKGGHIVKKVVIRGSIRKLSAVSFVAEEFVSHGHSERDHLCGVLAKVSIVVDALDATGPTLWSEFDLTVPAGLAFAAVVRGISKQLSFSFGDEFTFSVGIADVLANMAAVSDHTFAVLLSFLSPVVTLLSVFSLATLKGSLFAPGTGLVAVIPVARVTFLG